MTPACWSRWPRCWAGSAPTRAWTVHGQGLDELTTTGETEVAEWKDGAVRRFTVTPEDAGLARHDIVRPARRRRGRKRPALRALLAGRRAPIATSSC
jgi:anthranilate phosphoribosyltransferase